MEAKQIVKARPLAINDFANSPIHIIIPFKENHFDVGRLLDEIYLIRNVTYSISLVDDNSSNPSFLQQYKTIPFINCHRFDEDKGFGYCVNHAVKNNKADINFVLHSDVYNLPRNIFRDMSYALHYGREEKLACVSAMIDKPVPKSCTYLQIDQDADTDNYYKLMPEDGFLPFICVAFSKSAYGIAGGLATYPYCWFEDKLLAEKFRAFGYKMGISTRVQIRHHGSKTVNLLLSKDPEIAQTLKENKKKYESESELIKLAVQNKKEKS
jgi:hypothetical protein